MNNFTLILEEKDLVISLEEPKFTTFSDGSESCSVPVLDDITSVRVCTIVKDCTKDLIRIGLIKDALDRVYPSAEINLSLWYAFQARADRVFNKGDALPVKVFANILNSFNFNSVLIADPHSDVAPALINNIEVASQTECLKTQLVKIKNKMPNFTLCAPDLGATKKIFDTTIALGHDEYIQGIKIRNTKTGDIAECSVVSPEAVRGKDILIVDDIADGGASFKFLAQKLKILGAKRVGLYVTHAIFSKGLEPLEKDVDFIWCFGIIGSYINSKHIQDFNSRH